MTDRDSTLRYLKGGGKYVFVMNGNVFKIANQDLAALQQHAGHTVQLTGDLTGRHNYGLENRDACKEVIGAGG